MATSPVPNSQLDLTTSCTPDETSVHCTGKINFETTEFLKVTVKPLFSQSKAVVLDLRNVNYMDSSGLGAMIALYISAKTMNVDFRLTNLSRRLKELPNVCVI